MNAVETGGFLFEPFPDATWLKAVKSCRSTQQCGGAATCLLSWCNVALLQRRAKTTTFPL